MGRPVLLALRVVGVHGITRIHGGQKQKDIKSDPNLRSHHQRFFLGADAYRLYVFPPFSVFTPLIRFSSVPTDSPPPRRVALILDLKYL